MPRDDIALCQLGTAADKFQSDSHAEQGTYTDTISPVRRGATNVILFPSQDGRSDHFTRRDGMVFAGTHLIIDVWDAANLDDVGHIERTLRECVEVAGATLLHCHLHRFNPEGVSGVLVLAESHISIHTWPEIGYAALDVFMCGDSRPHKTVDVLRRGFATENIRVDDLRRGRVL